MGVTFTANFTVEGVYFPGWVLKPYFDSVGVLSAFPDLLRSWICHPVVCLFLEARQLLEPYAVEWVIREDISTLTGLAHH